MNEIASGKPEPQTERVFIAKETPLDKVMAAAMAASARGHRPETVAQCAVQALIIVMDSCLERDKQPAAFERAANSLLRQRDKLLAVRASEE